MSADRLRQAATLLRERAEAATPGPWRSEPKPRRADVRGLPENTSYDYRGDSVATAASGEFGACRPEDAAFIATMDPTVSLAVAAWLDDMAVGWNWDDDGREHLDADDNPLTLDESMDSHAVKIADAVLAEASR